MPTTSNFGWTTPADTDLVKDGAAAIRTLGNGIDTSLVDLKGGTTGQILSKASNTDLDYTWITNDVGDITNVGVTSPITGGGSSGSVTIGIQDGTTAQKGAVQLENSTSSTSTTTAAVPASVKSAYDLADGAIPKSLVDAKGDLIVGTADNTVARLASSASNGNVLTVDTSTASGLKWAAPAGGGKVLQVVSATSTTDTNVSSTTYTDTTLSASITPSATTSKVLVLIAQQITANRASDNAGGGLRILRGATSIVDYSPNGYEGIFVSPTGATQVVYRLIFNASYLDSPSTTSSTTYKTQIKAFSTANSGYIQAQQNNTTSSIILLEIGA